MIGAITGDIAGSRFEWDNHRSKDFELFADECSFTDDSVMSLAVCDALMRSIPDHSDLGEQGVLYVVDRQTVSSLRIRQFVSPVDIFRRPSDL